MAFGDKVSLSLGTSVRMEMRRVAYGDGRISGDKVVRSERVGIEFNMPNLPASDKELMVSIKPSGDLAASEASTIVDLLDTTIEIECLDGCSGGPADGGNEFTISLTNFPLFSDIALTDQVFTTFHGDASALAMELEVDGCPSGSTCLRLLVPSCNGCRFQGGAQVVPVKVGFKADSSRSSSIFYTYWAAPTILNAKMGAAGISVIVRFDQATNRAGMRLDERNCSSVLPHQLLSRLAADPADASCAWEASSVSLNILLGAGATIVPGDILAIQHGKLRSMNSLSDASVTKAEVLAPDVAEPPQLSVVGSSEIDPCSELEIRATVVSPRPAVFSWSCSNDPELDRVLSTLTGPVAFLEAGTAAMQDTDKTYRIVVSAKTFLGRTSIVHNVLKKASGAQHHFVSHCFSHVM